jgi:hypothetical protein
MIRDHLAVVDDQITGPTHCADTLSNQCVYPPLDHWNGDDLRNGDEQNDQPEKRLGISI